MRRFDMRGVAISLAVPGLAGCASTPLDVGADQHRFFRPDPVIRRAVARILERFPAVAQ